MNEKDLWKWILENFSDKGLANIGKTLGIKIPGFRQINPMQKNFTVLRPKLIQEALSPKKIGDLKDFFNTVTEKNEEALKYRGQKQVELMPTIGTVIVPSILLSALLSSPDEDDVKTALYIYTSLKEEYRLEELERQAEGTLNEENDSEVMDVESKAVDTEQELKQAHEKINSAEKKLKKSEQKNENLKAQLASIQASYDAEKKQWKEEKKKMTKDIQTLSSENGKTKSDARAALGEKDAAIKKLEQQQDAMKKKDDEISRLNALILKLKTDHSKEVQPPQNSHEPVVATETVTDQTKSTFESQGKRIQVAVIGDPKNSRVQRYKRFSLHIIEASELDEEKTHELFDSADRIWLLTYKTPRGVQKRIKTMLKDREIQEFTTFIDLENHMKKG
ncbi:hypothetical protein [Peribacillus kribbensis]|uniref:hypothetical protein n=1 Tax=Peribacillus kribbensis TaxID=356658 RepID=UPI000414E0DA|nr:hypothetical protein [Peribacillus kribbensis]